MSFTLICRSPKNLSYRNPRSDVSKERFNWAFNCNQSVRFIAEISSEFVEKIKRSFWRLKTFSETTFSVTTYITFVETVENRRIFIFSTSNVRWYQIVYFRISCFSKIKDCNERRICKNERFYPSNDRMNVLNRNSIDLHNFPMSSQLVSNDVEVGNARTNKEIFIDYLSNSKNHRNFLCSYSFRVARENRFLPVTKN